MALKKESDCGASAHMTGDASIFVPGSLRPVKTRIKFGNGEFLQATHIGAVRLGEQDVLCNVLLVPGMSVNLMSVSQFDQAGFISQIGGGAAKVFRP
eukprot:CAMPEP_0113941636 /NCGR_PEP_ID=MMETSP1339-20121228/7514_1 /TAXON_ID=94617 /ORGANISM="Fibrocapsa japonica" /LENGTH=96 /DNA_ID=CAMNT_0000945835 /DNA_START=57 /DNA_END=344 /DNA_ORIENTATION=- /assembly_acc=CAM_ASM_000762